MSANHLTTARLGVAGLLTWMKILGLNIGAHKEAIEHFLSALALQESSGGEKSEQLWTTLRRAFQAMVSPLPHVRSHGLTWVHHRTGRTWPIWLGRGRSWRRSVKWDSTSDWGRRGTCRCKDRLGSEGEKSLSALGAVMRR